MTQNYRPFRYLLDPLDVVAYFAGGAAALVFWRFFYQTPQPVRH